MSTDDTKIRTEAHVPPPEWSGAAFGIAILVFAVVLGGGYAWYRMNVVDAPPPTPERINDEPETARAVADVAILDAMSPSDDIASIRADLDATVLDSIDNDLTAIDAELVEFEARVNGR